jgi:hypothetical protein
MAVTAPPVSIRHAPLVTAVPWIAGFASIGAGAIHATAAGSHAEQGDLRLLFTGAAVAQIAWGVSVLRPSVRWWVASLGVLINGVCLAGWAASRLSGISSVDGLSERSPVGVPDAIAAGLATVAVVLALPFAARLANRFVLPGAAVALVASGIGVWQTTGHSGHDAHSTASVAPAAIPGSSLAGSVPVLTTVASSDATATTAPAAPVVEPFSPDAPINLGGMPGVTPEQQARAENLLAATVLLLPRYSDPEVAVADGFVSIGDGVTGAEHYVNWTYLNDGHLLDPSRPESLVYDTTVSPKKLVSAMFMLDPGTTLDTAPDIGGALTQWHVHDNLCFDGGRVVGLTTGSGECSFGSKGEALPMIHVWIEPHPCGPFAALEGVAAGSVKAGETHACDTVHGGH